MSVSRYFFVFITWLRLGYAQTCYWPDKSVAETLSPCNQMAEQSHCCGPDSLCLDNGYCFNQGNRYSNRISRGGCTDKLWGSSACPRYCQTTLPDGGISLALVSETNTGLFCCGVGYNASSGLCLAESQAGDMQPFSIDIGLAVLNRTSGSTNLDNKTSGTTATASATATSSPDTKQDRISTAVGAGVGASVGVLIVSAVTISLWRLKKRRASQNFQQFDVKSRHSPMPSRHIEHVELEHSPLQFHGLGIQELDGR